jgi:hypothetical protein
MPDERAPSVLGGLPRTRPHRRSEKRPAAEPSPPPPPAGTAGPAAKPPLVAPALKPRAAPKPKSRAAAKAKRKPATAPNGAKSKAKASSATKPAHAAAAASKPGGAAQSHGGTMRQPAQPRGTPPLSRAVKRPAPRPARPGATSGREIVGTAVQAAAELAEIGLAVSARAIRTAVSRLPRP